MIKEEMALDGRVVPVAPMHFPADTVGAGVAKQPVTADGGVSLVDESDVADAVRVFTNL